MATPTLSPITPFIKAFSTPLNTAETTTSTPSNISYSASTTSCFTPLPLFIPNRSVTRSQSQLQQIPLNVPFIFLAQNVPVTTTSLPTEANVLSFLALTNFPEPYEPLTYADAVRDTSPYHLQWQAAMQEEFNSLIENHTWGLSAIPPNRVSLGGKWVFKLKQGPKGEIT